MDIASERGIWAGVSNVTQESLETAVTTLVRISETEDFKSLAKLNLAAHEITVVSNQMAILLHQKLERSRVTLEKEVVAGLVAVDGKRKPVRVPMSHKCLPFCFGKFSRRSTECLGPNLDIGWAGCPIWESCHGYKEG